MMRFATAVVLAAMVALPAATGTAGTPVTKVQGQGTDTNGLKGKRDMFAAYGSPGSFDCTDPEVIDGFSGDAEPIKKGEISLR
jgi:hypothetical protein